MVTFPCSTTPPGGPLPVPILNKRASYETFTGTKRWSCFWPEEEQTLQELWDFLQQHFHQSDANSKGQRPYLNQGRPKQRLLNRKEGSSSRFSCQWGYQVKMWSPQRFLTIWRWLKEGHPRLKWFKRSQLLQGGTGPLGCDPSS